MMSDANWLYLVFRPTPDGRITLTTAVPPELEAEVLVDVAHRHGAAAAVLNPDRCRGDAVYHLDLGGVVFKDDPAIDIALGGGRTLRIWKHQAGPILDVVRSLEASAALRVGASGVPWTKAHGHHHCCVLLASDLPQIVAAILPLGDLSRLEAEHRAVVASVLGSLPRTGREDVGHVPN